MKTPIAGSPPPQVPRPQPLPLLTTTVVGVWVALIVIYAAGIARVNQVFVSTGGGHAVQVFSDAFVRERLWAPLAYPRANLRGAHIGAVAAFADRLLIDVPENATIYVQFDPENAPDNLTAERWHSVCFDNYAYLAYRLYPRRVHVTTPGTAIRDPVFFPLGQVPPVEEIGLPRSTDWLQKHGFDYHVIYLPFVGVGHYGPVLLR